ncbi:MAG: GntR family transcriptional regulator, partial [Patescibacteria group bacterium]|nr:GntR family transcriptional regulator [Patescibacteria group bacterium]
MESTSLFQQAYSRIQEEILRGELPPGGRVSEISLAKQLGLGRAPVREALRQLQNDGVMRQIPRYGTVVRMPRRRDVIDIYELREA